MRRPALIAVLGAVVFLSACTTSVVDGQGSLAGGGSGTSAPSSFPSGSGGGSSGAGSSQPPAQFRDCKAALNLGLLKLSTDRRQHLRVECARIPVPLDYTRPNGRTIDIQLLRLGDDRDTKPVGQLLVNPGGPGGSGVNLAAGLAGRLSDAVFSRFDIVGFDPRGVGLSTPISCLTTAQKDRLNAAAPNPLTAAGRAEAKANAKEFADACNSKYGTDLADYNTEATARDIDRIRQAVGDSKLNWLGFSYGTELGAAYAHLFPRNIRVMVLDGAVDPLTDGITAFANQLQGFEGAFDQFAAWCVKNAPCSSLGNARQAVAKVAAAAAKSPLHSSANGETRTATTSIVYTAVLSALYSQSDWPVLANALIQGERGDAAGLFTLADQYNERSGGQYTNLAEANTTIGCNDSKPGPTDAEITATAVAWQKRFPIFGLWSAPSLYTCQQWQPDRTPVPLPTARNSSAKILVIGNLHDPATPYQGAVDLTKTLGNAQLLSWDGEGHTSYLQGSSCIDGYVNAYLVSGTLPPPGKVCPR